MLLEILEITVLTLSPLSKLYIIHVYVIVKHVNLINSGHALNYTSVNYTLNLGL